jgi:hypothetical protein
MYAEIQSAASSKPSSYHIPWIQPQAQLQDFSELTRRVRTPESMLYTDISSLTEPVTQVRTDESDDGSYKEPSHTLSQYHSYI